MFQTKYLHDKTYRRLPDNHWVMLVYSMTRVANNNWRRR